MHTLFVRKALTGESGMDTLCAMQPPKRIVGSASNTRCAGVGASSTAATIVLDDGDADRRGRGALPRAGEPSKIIAVHLTYRSRVEEYAARTPAAAVVLHEAADDAQRPPRRRSAAPRARASSTTRASSRS